MTRAPLRSRPASSVCEVVSIGRGGRHKDSAAANSAHSESVPQVVKFPGNAGKISPPSATSEASYVASSDEAAKALEASVDAAAIFAGLACWFCHRFCRLVPLSLPRWRWLVRKPRGTQEKFAAPKNSPHATRTTARRTRFGQTLMMSPIKLWANVLRRHSVPSARERKRTVGCALRARSTQRTVTQRNIKFRPGPRKVADFSCSGGTEQQ